MSAVAEHPPASAASSAHRLRRSLPSRADVLGATAAAVGALLVATWVLQLWHASLRVPVWIGGDATSTLSAIKNLLHGDWYYTTKLLGAPFGQKLYDFPATGDSWHLLELKAFGIFTSDPALAMNTFFIATFPLAALGAYISMRLLGVQIAIASALAVVYSILPYHFERNEVHLFLSAYFAVPLACLVLIRQMDTRTMARVPRRGISLRQTLFSKGTIGAALVCILLAGTGLYYAFFFVLLVAIVGLVTSVRARGFRPLASAAMLAAIVASVLVLSNLPSLIYTARQGENPQGVTRLPYENEIYGLKIANLVLPVPGHRIQALADLKEESLGGPIQSEPSGALGLIGAVGFLGLLAAGLSRLTSGRDRGVQPDAADRSTIEQISALTVACISFAAIGGLSLVMGAFGFTEIRAWNRVSVYIAFLALAAVGIWLTRQLRRRARGKWLWRTSIAAAIALVLFAGYDQTTPAFTPDYAANAVAYGADRAFVRQIERALGRSASIYQLPYVTYPEANPVVGVYQWDSVRGYLHSNTLRWSLGGVAGREIEWQPALSTQPTSVAITGMAAAGFDGLSLDRAGYSDGAAQIESEIVPILGVPVVESQDGRLAVFDLRPVRRRLAHALSPARLSRARSAVLHPASAHFASGFSGEERDASSTWEWATSSAKLVITNPTGKIQRVHITFGVDSLDPQSQVTVSGLGDGDVTLPTRGPGARFDRQVALRPGRTRVRFRSDAAPRPATGTDTPDLSFRITDFHMSSWVLDEAAPTVLTPVA